MRLNVFNFFYHKRRIRALKQHDSIDCGPPCLKIISLYYNKNIPIEDLVKWSCVSRNGVSLYGINLAAKKIGFDTESILLSIDEFIGVFKNPCIIHCYHNSDTYSNSNKVTILGNLQIKNVWFSYKYPEQDMILKNINLNIPANKVTAIVGTSGSGKTTLIKLMLGFVRWKLIYLF